MTRVDFIKTRLLAPPPRGIPGILYGCAAILVPTLIRASIDPLVSGTTFAAYYPFILCAALFLGWQRASGVAVASAVVANFLFMEPRYTFFTGAGDGAGAASFLFSAGLMILVARALRRTVEEAEALREREGHLNRELQHRVKNTLAVVQALATQTIREPAAAADLRKYQGRIQALADAHDILSSGRCGTCRLPELAARALAPFIAEGGISLYGPPCTLRDETCVPLVLALHELATNATKYGALSTPEGSVDLVWTLSPHGEDEQGVALVLEWFERGGPAVLPPARRGLGTKLLRAQPGIKDVRLEFRPEGVTCRIEVSGARVRSEDAEDLVVGAPATLYSTGSPDPA